jgi:hypothetical protein
MGTNDFNFPGAGKKAEATEELNTAEPGMAALLGQMALTFGDNRPRRDCSTCIGPTFFRPICNGCEEHSAWEAVTTTEQTIDRLMELAHELATAEGVTRLNHYRTGEYNEDNCRAASSRLRAALTAAMTHNVKWGA